MFLPFTISKALYKGLLMSVLVVLLNIGIRAYTTVVDFKLLFAASRNESIDMDYWLIWIVLQIIGLYNFISSAIDYFTLDEISDLTTIKFENDIKKCPSSKLYASSSELYSIYEKLYRIRFIPGRLGWLLGSFGTIINASFVIWQVNPHWIWMIILSSFCFCILDDYIFTKAQRKQMSDQYTEKYRLLQRSIAYIPEGNTTKVFNWRKEFQEKERDLRLIDRKINDFYIKKNIIPSIGNLLATIFILRTYSNDYQIDVSILLLSFMNLQTLAKGSEGLINSFNNIRSDIAKCDDYEREIVKLYGDFDKIKKLSDKIPTGITQLLGESGTGKTVTINKIVDAIGTDVIYLAQSDISNFCKMTPIQAVLFMQLIKDEGTAKRALELACFHKSFTDELERPSGGEHQKLRVARSIYQFLTLKRKIWIIDELDNNIHPGTEISETNGYHQIMTNIFGIMQSDTKLIFTTHKGFALNGIKAKISKIHLDNFCNSLGIEIKKQTYVSIDV
jgi:hypothetical protein